MSIKSLNPGKCKACHKKVEVRYSEDDCEDCMIKRHEEIGKRLFSEMFDHYMGETLDDDKR